MKFSLKTTFALITLACLAALLVREIIFQQQLDRKIANCKTELESLEAPTVEEIRAIRRLAQPDPDLVELTEHMQQNVEGLFEKWKSTAKDNGQVSVFSAPPLADDELNPFHIYLPETRSAFLTIKALPYGKSLGMKPPFEPARLKLRLGFNTFHFPRLRQLDLNTGGSVLSVNTESKLNFTINEETFEADFGKPVTFLLPRSGFYFASDQAKAGSFTIAEMTTFQAQEADFDFHIVCEVSFDK